MMQRLPDPDLARSILLRLVNPAGQPHRLQNPSKIALQCDFGQLWHFDNAYSVYFRQPTISEFLLPHRPDRRHDHDDGDELQQ